MTKNEEMVLTKQYSEAVKVWDKILSHGENLSIIFPPISDSQRRITQFIEKNSDKYLFLDVNPLDLVVEEVSDLENSLLFQAKQRPKFKKLNSFESLISVLKKDKQQLVIVCVVADFILAPRGRHYLTLFQKIIIQYAPNLVCLFSFETDITKPELSSLVRGYHSVFQHITYYPLYSPADTLTFIKYFCDKWNLKISAHRKKEIVEKCGGYYWLVKEALRQIRDNGSWNKNSEQFYYRLQTIAQSFSENEYTTMVKIFGKSRGLTESQIHSKEYLFKIGMIDKGGFLTVPLLKDELIKLGSSKRKLVLKGSEIILNEVPVTKYFSKQEYRIIKLLLSKEGQVVTRDEIANVIWPDDTDTHFSEWAIDQLVKRLRDRMLELLIPKTVLTSVRGKGYTYVQS